MSFRPEQQVQLLRSGEISFFREFRSQCMRFFDCAQNDRKVDALTAAYAQRSDIELATFDNDFDDSPGVTRWQPDNEAGYESW